MIPKSASNRKLFRFEWFQALLISILIAGIFLRFINLDRKIFWHDEVFSSFRIYGYTVTVIVEQTFHGREVGVEDLQKFQQPSPNKHLEDTIHGLIKEEPQLTPMYYVMGHFWVKLFGDSVEARRSLSACLSVLVFPCLYWLCLELFKTHLVGAIAMAFVAVSPFHIAYAQEARAYVLWTVTMLLSSAALLWAMRKQTKVAWLVYMTTLTVGLYAFLSSLLIMAAHGIYVLVKEKFRFSQTVKAYLVASSIALLLFSPWLIVLFSNLNGATTAVTGNQKTFFLDLVIMWANNIASLFTDWTLPRYVAPIALLFVGYLIYFSIRYNKKNDWIFPVILIVTTWVPLIALDIFTGGRRSGINRYVIPSHLGIQILFAYFLSLKLSDASFWRSKIWKVSLAGLFAIMLILGIDGSKSQLSLSKETSRQNIPIAKLINQSQKPLMISDRKKWNTNLADIISLSYLLKQSQVRFLLFDNPPSAIQVPNHFTEVYVYAPSNELRSLLEVSYGKIKPVVSGFDKELYQVDETALLMRTKK
ncbi:hypothetical protein TUMEXPCC7403_16835 [Tumidithrix helvetica PCC 7403]|uniref:glycosyltransferase family 39 protein n=1 Tax=Tumidithrix helvetica TaxID=3457545 RepID=UPI003C8A667E